MALVECSECGKRVSNRAAACPKCGAPIGGASPAEAEAGGRPHEAPESEGANPPEGTDAASVAGDEGGARPRRARSRERAAPGGASRGGDLGTRRVVACLGCLGLGGGLVWGALAGYAFVARGCEGVLHPEPSETAAMSVAVEVIKSALKTPGSAKFFFGLPAPKVLDKAESSTERWYVVTRTFDAQNLLGALIRQHGTVVLLWKFDEAKKRWDGASWRTATGVLITDHPPTADEVEFLKAANDWPAAPQPKPAEPQQPRDSKRGSAPKQVPWLAWDDLRSRVKECFPEAADARESPISLDWEPKPRPLRGLWSVQAGDTGSVQIIWLVDQDLVLGTEGRVASAESVTRAARLLSRLADESVPVDELAKEIAAELAKRRPRDPSPGEQIQWSRKFPRFDGHFNFAEQSAHGKPAGTWAMIVAVSSRPR